MSRVFAGLGGPLPEPQFAGRIRKEQIGAVLRMTPAMLAANVLNGLVLLYACWSADTSIFLVAWFLALLVLVIHGSRAWFRSRHRPAPAVVSSDAIRRATRNALVLGLLWALVPPVLFPNASGPQQLTMMVLVTAIMGGGGFGLSTIPPAAFAFVGAILVGSLGTLLISSEPLFLAAAVLLLTYALIVGRSILWHADLFIRQLKNQYEVEHQSELIGILLRDFEESASDWLWELDASGRIPHVSRRFAEVAGRPEDQIRGRRLVEFLAAAERANPREGGQMAVAELERLLEERQPFRDLVVDVEAAGEARAWSLSGKPVHDLQGRFTGYRGVGADVTDRRRTEGQLAYLARYDSLTDLANRSYYNECLSEACATLERAGLGFALLCVDLDGFKTINDTYGHAPGDRLLKFVARRLKRCAREGDLVARIGGDEFAVIQRAQGQPMAAASLAQRIIDTLSAPYDLDGHRVVLGASVGFAIAPQDGAAAQALARHADLALYCAKREGRGVFRRYEADMTMRSSGRQSIGKELRAAFRNGEIDLRFQPVARLDSGAISGAATSLGWNHPRHGWIPQPAMMAMVKEAGLLPELTEWLCDKACSTASAWPKSIRLSIPLDLHGLRPDGLAAMVARILCQHEEAARGIEIEIGERALLDNEAEMLKSFAALREQGVGIVLNNFGAGFSSLGHLRRFSFNRLTLDATFLSHAGCQADDIALVRAIAGLARSLDMQTTAQGVSKVEQRRALFAAGCTEATGSLIGASRTDEEFASFLGSWSGWPDVNATDGKKGGISWPLAV